MKILIYEKLRFLVKFFVLFTFISISLKAENWIIRRVDEAERTLPLFPGEPLNIEISCKEGLIKEVKVFYSSRRLLKGDTVYKGGKVIEYKNFEMEEIFQGEKTIVLSSDSKGMVTGRLTINLPEVYGFFYLSVIVKDMEGKELVKKDIPYNVVVKISMDTLENNIAGLDSFGWVYSWGDPNTDFPWPTKFDYEFLKTYGFSWVHIRADWHRTHIAPGKITRLDILDKWVDAAKQQNAKIIMCLADAAHAYGDKITGIASLSEDAEHWDMNLYKEWAEAIISRYKDKVEVWDVWNEPDSKSYAQREDRDIQAIKIVYELKEKYCPHTKVIISPHDGYGLNYLKRILEKGVGKYLDGIGLHPYRGVPPEIPEPDGYIGNPTGVRTFLSSLEMAHKLLIDYNVVPPEIYITEMNYALNTLPQLDDLDQANFMVRCNILSLTTGYTKCFIHHAFGNGRLAPSTYPNMVNNMANTKFIKKIETQDSDIYAYLFEKKNCDEFIMPIWAIKNEKIIKISGLTEQPELVDMYGNKIEVDYDTKRGVADFVRISQSPVYLKIKKSSNPIISISKLLEIQSPKSIERGKEFIISVKVKNLREKKATINLQTISGWSIVPSSILIEKSGTYDFKIKIPPDAVADKYPLIVVLKGEGGKIISIESIEIEVLLPEETMKKEFGVVFSSQFDKEGFTGWEIQKSEQSEVDISYEKENKGLKIVQKGIDIPAVLRRKYEPVKYGVLGFDIKFLSEAPFNLLFDDIRILFKEKNIILQRKEEGDLKIENYQIDKWQKFRIFFSSPDGWFRIWIDEKFSGEFYFKENSKGFSNLLFMPSLIQTKKPGTFLINNVSLIKIEPVELDSNKQLLWSICGPFPNRIDPSTMKRPFEMDIDYLTPVGGETNINPYPGLQVPTPDGNICRFLPFYLPQEQDRNTYLIDFFQVKWLNLFPHQVDIICYAACYFISKEEKEITIIISSDDSHALWINHNFIGKFNAWPTGCSIGQYPQKYKIKVKKGLNLILIKVDQGSGAFGFNYTINY